MARLSTSGPGQGQLSLNPLGVQFFSSLEGLEVTTSAHRQLIRGHNLVGAVRLQFIRPSFFDDEAGEHRDVLDGTDGIDVPLSSHVYPFPQPDEWEGHWFFFDVQLHPYQLHFRRKVEDGNESATGMWEDLYGKLAQVRGQMCLQPIATRSLRLVGRCFPTIAPRASFQGPIDTATFRFKEGSLTINQLKCCGFVQCRTYLTPPRDGDTPFKGGQAFHILAYMPHDQQPWKSRIDWMKNSAEGGFASRKWIYGRGGIVGVLNTALLEQEPEPGQDILVVLVDEFGFTSRATFDGSGAAANSDSPQRTRGTEKGKGRNPFSSSPVGSSPKRLTEPSSLVDGKGNVKRQGKKKATEENESSEIAKPLSPARLSSPGEAGPRPERQQDSKDGREDNAREIVIEPVSTMGVEEVDASLGRSPLKRGAASNLDGTSRKRQIRGSRKEDGS